jgi:hypothetical protein
MPAGAVRAVLEGDRERLEGLRNEVRLEHRLPANGGVPASGGDGAREVGARGHVGDSVVQSAALQEADAAAAGGGGRAASATPGAGGAGLASMLDLDGDGNPLDDILGMAGKLMG